MFTACLRMIIIVILIMVSIILVNHDVLPWHPDTTGYHHTGGRQTRKQGGRREGISVLWLTSLTVARRLQCYSNPASIYTSVRKLILPRVDSEVEAYQDLLMNGLACMEEPEWVEEKYASWGRGMELINASCPSLQSQSWVRPITSWSWWPLTSSSLIMIPPIILNSPSCWLLYQSTSSPPPDCHTSTSSPPPAYHTTTATTLHNTHTLSQPLHPCNKLTAIPVSSSPRLIYSTTGPTTN